MGETYPKRQREETQTEDNSDDLKRHKSYNQLLSYILDDEEDEPTQDLSDMFTTFQQELSSDDFPDFDPLPNPTQDSDPCEESTLILPTASDYSPSSSSSQANKVLNIQNEEDDDKERVIRHLLEASDDELGIPHRVMDGGNFDEVETNVGDHSTLGSCDGLWEIEDEAANYYTLLQSELFM